MKPHSLDLRENIVRASDEQCGSQRALAALFGVSRSCVETRLQRGRMTGAHGLGPALVPDDRVVLDHLAAHTAVGIKPRPCVRLLDVPPYSPALSPSAPGWSQVKTGRRTATAQPREALDTALSQALAPVTAVDAHRWCKRCGAVWPTLQRM
jgi:hypothetical protein